MIDAKTIMEKNRINFPSTTPHRPVHIIHAADKHWNEAITCINVSKERDTPSPQSFVPWWCQKKTDHNKCLLRILKIAPIATNASEDLSELRTHRDHPVRLSVAISTGIPSSDKLLYGTCSNALPAGASTITCRRYTVGDNKRLQLLPDSSYRSAMTQASDCCSSSHRVMSDGTLNVNIN